MVIHSEHGPHALPFSVPCCCSFCRRASRFGAVCFLDRSQRMTIRKFFSLNTPPPRTPETLLF